jgi:hypothetical protein
MQARKSTGNDLQAFQTILDFVTNLNEFFGEGNRSLGLYYRLISKMSFQDDDLILRHLGVFKEFCVLNRTSIRNQSHITHPRIQFSEKIYIDINYILKSADSETTQVIWDYILAISALLDPENNAREIYAGKHASDGLLTPQTSPQVDMMGSMMGMMNSMMSGGGLDGIMGMMAGGFVGGEGVGGLDLSGILKSDLFNNVLQTVTKSLDEAGGIDTILSGLMKKPEEIASSVPSLDPSLVPSLDPTSVPTPSPDEPSI